jgi:carbon storage regulator CsrA
MLVITRKAGQSILIDKQVKLVVLKISGDKIQIGFEAPRGVKILRGEVAGVSPFPPALSTGPNPLSANERT